MKLGADRNVLPLVFACIAILAMRVSGVHLHLCFDGQEPPQSLHWSDSGTHDDQGHTEDHSDVDLSLTADGLVKKLSSAADLPALLAVVIALFLPLATVALRSEARVLRRDSLRRFFQPQLRAPPL